MIIYLLIGVIFCSPILLFVGFSGGFKRNKGSCSTRKYDTKTKILTTETWFLDKTKTNETKQHILIDNDWYTYPDKNKCNKKTTKYYNNYIIDLHNNLKNKKL